ncbi:MAG TPA: PTS sugar transporter subunit IIA [Candidatus Merdicola faecigallinarum]|uniref:PTS sugar transporter subunit IIA n=1 Tax=Candidatus Merdicola faecigallinarum TaxID=2840862 RepID=A0A9D1M1K1_9FIRM|nr:PTS sugar transporter subunit IIA [Candidatus Merdicola faecigallinarum]
MRITDLLSRDAVELNVSAGSKNEIIQKMVDLMDKTGNISDKKEYERLVFEREKEGTTGVGEGIAIPHGKSDCVKRPGLAAAVVPNGVEFDSLDGKPVNLIFLIAAPNTKDNVHLDVLSRLSTLLMDLDFKNKLVQAKTKEEFLRLIDKAEKEKFANEVKEETESGYEILGITACPTGIAHTYMAAESLENKGKELGHLVKIETQGQSGVKNRLTKEEIRRAKAIIIAADVNVDLSRFDGKRVVRAKVADGIHKPEELIKAALDPEKTPIYHHTGNQEVEENGKDGLGSRVYKHLMSGVTHMLPFVVGGGILIAISFLLDDYSINPANFGMNTPIAAFFKTIGGFAFDFMLCILAGYIAMSIADRPGLAVGFVGGAIAKAGTTFSSLTNSDEVLVSSGFIGALLAGFIGGFVVLLLRRLFRFLPKSLEGIKPILIYPVGGILLIGLIMVFINPFVATINTGLNNFLSSMSGANKILLGAILGGMMSVDLGGPFNKAAYTFGTGMLAEGQYEIMAAVMAGGMVAPLAIAILATFFPKKLPKKDRQSALLNYVMGFSFITEGAIPFASADPLRVLVSCIIGSAVSGAMSMLFGCTLMAPHGGIFVLPVVGNAALYLVSIVVGSVVAALIMAAWKKNVWENSDKKKNVKAKA